VEGAGLLYQFNEWVWSAVDLLFQPPCCGCNNQVGYLCQECQNKIQPLSKPYCHVCGSPCGEEYISCNCESTSPAYDAIRSFAVYKEPLRSVIHYLKYGQGNAGLGMELSRPLVYLLKKFNWSFYMVIPVPLGTYRQRERGYNQAALLAKPVAYYFQKKYSPSALIRIRETASQVGFSPDDRRKNVAGAFYAKKEMVEKRSVLLVDDVITTGATLDACADALKTAGASKVYGISLARAVGFTSRI